MSHLPRTFVTLAAALAAAAPLGALAQSLPYGDMGGSSSSGGGYSGGDQSGSDSASESGRGSRGSRGSREGSGRYGVHVTPYLEASQVATAELSPGNDVLTYSRVAAGVDAAINGRNTGLSASVRYEHYFGWGKKADDQDVVSGIARGYATITPGIQIEAGGMAGTTRIDGNGSSVLGPLSHGKDVTNVYSVYGGPTVDTQVGAVKVDGGYRLGYSRVDSPNSLVTTPGQAALDVFDDSVTHNASLHAAIKPGEGLPVGVAVGGDYYREDISNLDQRVKDASGRVDVTVPITHEFAVVGGIGYEDVTITSRDALRDANGVPVIGSGGHYATDKSSPRRIAMDTSGLIWDAGVIWRPNRRTMLEAHVGKRYGSTTYTGTFTYAASARSNIGVSVYDTVAGFGGQMNRALAAMPTSFEANRDPLTGNITGCVAATEGNTCLSDVLGSVRSSTFRNRGVKAAYNVNMGRLTAGVAAGYDQRKYIAAPGTVLASANGMVDENIWMAGYINAKLSQNSSLGTTVYTNWFKSGDELASDSRAIGATASYGHQLTRNLSATAALGVDGVMRDDPVLDDVWTASALVGVRYSF